MPLLRPVAVTIALLAAVALALPAGAGAHRTAPCIPGKPGARCDVWTGKVRAVDDGDTYDINIKGDGRRGPARIRLTGVNAMQPSVYTSIRRKRRGALTALEDPP